MISIVIHLLREQGVATAHHQDAISLLDMCVDEMPELCVSWVDVERIKEIANHEMALGRSSGALCLHRKLWVAPLRSVFLMHINLTRLFCSMSSTDDLSRWLGR